MINFNEILESITLKDFIYFIIGVITVLSVIVENSKKLPFNPWTKLLDWVGKRVMSDIKHRLDNIEKQQKTNIEAINRLEEKMDDKFEENQRCADEKEAKRLRMSIIEFADSCRCGTHHTQNHFENVMRDYSDYIRYCENRKIPNHFIESEFRYIQEIYQECLKENKFI